MRIAHFTTKYISGEPVIVERSTYVANGHTALLLFSEHGEPLCTATVNLPQPVMLQADEVLIKDWSENEGVMQALIDAGVIGPVMDSHGTGFVYATRHKLLVDLPTANGGE